MAPLIMARKKPLSTCTLLDPETNISDSVAFDVIFVHGLRSKGTAPLRKQLKIWLREVQKSTGYRIWRFGFDGKEMLTEGRQRLVVLAGNLLKDIQNMPGYSPSKPREAETSNQERRLVFIGHGAAGWVIQAALAWYSTSSTQTARCTAMTIFLTLPLVKDQEDLDNYSEKFLHLYSSATNNSILGRLASGPVEQYPGKEKSSLRYKDTMQFVQRNFKNLVSSSFGPVEKHLFMSPPKDPVQSEGILRRETSATDGSNSSDSSQISSILTAGQLSWDIQVKDKTDTEVRALLYSCTELKKSERLTRKEQDRLVFQPLVEKYGRTEAKEFLGVNTQTFNSLREVSLLSPQQVKAVSALDGNGTQSVKIALLDTGVDPIFREELVSSPTLPRSSTAPGSSNSRKTSMSDGTGSSYESLSDKELIAESHETAVKSERHLLKQGQHEQKHHSEYAKYFNHSIPSDSSDNLRQILNLAFSFQYSGEMRKAKNIYEYVVERIATVPQLKNGIDAINCQIAITELYEGHVKKAQKVFTELEPKARATYDKKPQWSWEIERWLAVSFDMQGAYRKGRQKLIDINSKMSSSKIISDVTFLTKSTLALVSGHLGRYQEALSRSEEVLQLAYDAVNKAKRAEKAERAERLEPSERPERLDSKKTDLLSLTRRLGALGAVQFDRATILSFVGRFKEAEAMNDEAAKNIEKNLGSKHVATLDCWSLKSRLYASLSKLPEAEQQCQKTLNVMRKEIGKEHPSTLRTLGILVHVYRLQARLTEALNNARYLVERYTNSEELGGKHPETINSMWQLAEVYLARGDLPAALHLQAKVVKLAEKNKSLGNRHPTVINYRLCLARVYCNRGTWTLSVHLCFDVLEDCDSILSAKTQNADDDTHVEDESVPKAGEVSRDLAIKERIPISQIMEKARHAFTKDDKDFETTNLLIASTLKCLGSTERERLHGNLDIAQEMHTSAYKHMSKNFEATHVDTLSTRWELALTRLKNGHNDAISELSEVTEIRRRILGEDHPDTLASRHHLSVARFNASHDSKELVEQAEVLRLCILVLGLEHSITNSARIDLANGYRSIDKLEEAERLHLEALSVQIKTLRQPRLTGSEKTIYDETLEKLGVQVQDQPDIQETDPAPTHCHEAIISNLASLALIYVDLAQSQSQSPPSPKSSSKSSSLFEKAIAVQHLVISQQTLLGPPGSPKSPEVLGSINILALIYQAASLTPLAITQYQLISSEASESSVLHFTAQSDLGTLFFRQGDYVAAEEIQKKAYKKREKYGVEVVGEKEFVIAAFNLALTEEKLGKKEEAFRFMRQAVDGSEAAFGKLDATRVRILDTWTEWCDAEAEGKKA